MATQVEIQKLINLFNNTNYIQFQNLFYPKEPFKRGDENNEFLREKWDQFRNKPIIFLSNHKERVIELVKN